MYMLKPLKKEVCDANLDLVTKGVVIYSRGNVNGISEDRKYMAKAEMKQYVLNKHYMIKHGTNAYYGQ
jgi:hypothetical protein